MLFFLFGRASVGVMILAQLITRRPVVEHAEVKVCVCVSYCVRGEGEGVYRRTPSLLNGGEGECSTNQNEA